MKKLITLLVLSITILGCEGPKGPDTKYDVNYIEHEGQEIYIDSCVSYNTFNRQMTIKVNCQDYFHPNNYTMEEIDTLRKQLMKDQDEGKLNQVKKF